ncbi:hypothetical protein NX801_30570 [Streptomyces sp. LP05-1]|uniref:Uncharacterized protein n=1 Tax=Streptomyces pyxinae TaxID=2970734 RepID=A0ABT2CRH2_9ACTN|nr:hypothetical protein [Streptomyces sp. LP05-1]MCS0639900.1 hypothetical protein [Streptomyces sp. LP05-1]
MTYHRFVVGDVVRDTARDLAGTVWDRRNGVLDLKDTAGYTWRALPHRCVLLRPAPPRASRVPPGTVPVICTPAEVRVGDYVQVDGRGTYRIRDMRSNGPGERVLHLEGYPRPWRMPTGVRQVYRPEPPAA